MPELGAFVQQQYDAGRRVVTLDGGSWVWDTPLFLDDPLFGDQFELNATGAHIALTTNLPTTGGAFTPDKGRPPVDQVRCAVFPNTLRSSWNRTTNDVQVTPYTKATGEKVGGAMRLRVRGGTFGGGSRNVGLVFANRVGTLLEGVVLLGGRFALSWTDYTEPNIVRGCHFRTAGTAQPDDAWFVYQTTKGDGVIVDATKCDGAVGLASLRENFGAAFTGNITGAVRLTRCSGVAVVASHQEAGIGETYTPNFEVRDSEVLFVGGTFYPPRLDGRATIEVHDTPTGPNFSSVRLVAPNYRLLAAHAADAAAFVDVKSRNANTVVRVDDLTPKTSTGPGVWSACAVPAMNGVQL